MSPSEPEETYLTVAEVAETLKLNQQTVRNWIDQGSLPALRVGRRVRIKRSDFERILEESYSPGATAPGGRASPSADDFWGGESVGVAEPGPGNAASGAATAGEGGG
jgi:excisionase family DNA binding protein